MAVVPFDFIAEGLIALFLGSVLMWGALHIGGKVMAALDVLGELKALVADLKALDFVGFVHQLQSDATGAEQAIEAELHTLLDDLRAVVENVKGAVPAPAVPSEPAAEPVAEHPAA